MRQEIYHLYWSQDKVTDTKQQFIFSCLEEHSTVHSRKRDPDSNKSKQNTLQYYFTVKDTGTRVCKLMFLITLSISYTIVVNVLKNIEPGGMVKGVSKLLSIKYMMTLLKDTFLPSQIIAVITLGKTVMSSIWIRT